MARLNYVTLPFDFWSMIIGMELQTLLSKITMALRQLFNGDASIPIGNFLRGKYVEAYPYHTTVIRYTDGMKFERGGQIFFISYDQYPVFRDVNTTQIGSFRIIGGQVMWKELDIDIDLRSLSDPDAFPLEWG